MMAAMSTSATAASRSTRATAASRSTRGPPPAASRSTRATAASRSTRATAASRSTVATSPSRSTCSTTSRLRSILSTMASTRTGAHASRSTSTLAPQEVLLGPTRARHLGRRSSAGCSRRGSSGGCHSRRVTGAVRRWAVRTATMAAPTVRPATPRATSTASWASRVSTGAGWRRTFATSVAIARTRLVGNPVHGTVLGHRTARNHLARVGPPRQRRPWHILNFLPEPHGQGPFLGVFASWSSVRTADAADAPSSRSSTPPLSLGAV